jgi:hypothetical protein
MKRMKKKIFILSCALAALSLLCTVWVHQVSALEFEVKITNLSGATAMVKVYSKGATGAASLYSTLTIPNNQNQTTSFLSLTGLCPSYLTGTVGSKNIYPMTCNGNESASTTERCCASPKFNIVKKSDGTYHFEKTL